MHKASGKDKKSKEKAAKKLKPFFDAKREASKKCKAVTSFLELAPGEEEIRNFFSANYVQAYAVFDEAFTTYEAVSKKGKYDQKEVLSFVSIVKNIVIHCRQVIKTKWQLSSIVKFMEKCLYKENKSVLRTAAFDLLLHLLDALESPEREIVDLIAPTINLNSFAEGYTGTVQKGSWTRVLEAPDRSDVLLPAAAGETTASEESIKLLSALIDFMGIRPETFGFWFEIFKTNILNIFCAEIKAKYSTDTVTGFRPYPPHSFQDVLVDRLAHWMRFPAIVTVLVTYPDNKALILGLYEHAVASSSRFETIRKFIHVYRALCWPNTPPVPEIRDNALQYKKFFIDGLAVIFQTQAVGGKMDDHVALCKEILQLFKTFTEKTTDADTHQQLLTVLLGIATALLSTNQNKLLADRIGQTVVDMAIWCWVRSGTERAEVWEQLQSGISALFIRNEVIETVRARLVELTHMILTFIYPAPEKKRKPGSEQGEDGAQEEQPKEPVKEVVPIKSEEPLAAPQPWTVDTVVYVWHNLLNIFASVNGITDGERHAAVMSVITDVIDMILVAENICPYHLLTDSSRPAPLELVDIFGQWLFEACHLGDELIKGKCKAYAALCKLVVRHTHNRLPLSFLVHFYRVIHEGMTKYDIRCTYAIVANSTQIFGLALEGASILVPCYIAACRYMLSSGANPSPSQEEREAAVCILSSLCCIPDHLPELEIPTDSGPYKCRVIREEVSALLQDALRQDPSADIKVRCAWALCVLIFQEMHAAQSRSEEVQGLLTALMESATFEDEMVVSASLDSILALVPLLQKIDQLDKALLPSVLLSLTENVLRLLSSFTHGKRVIEVMIAKHLEAIQDWLLNAPTDILSNSGLAMSVFSVLELALFGEKVGDGGSRLPDWRAQVSRLNATPSHHSAIIREAGEALLFTLEHHYAAFPPADGIAVMTALLKETDDLPEENPPEGLVYIYNSYTIISVVEIPPSTLDPDAPSTARFIIRDPSGKYAWDSNVSYRKLFKEEETSAEVTDITLPSDNSAPEPSNQRAIQPRKLDSSADFSMGALLYNPESTQQQGVDKLDSLLKYLGRTYEECKQQGGESLDVPALPSSNFAEELDRTEKALLEQASEDKRPAKQRVGRGNTLSRVIVPIVRRTDKDRYRACRAALQHLGFLSIDDNGRGGPTFALLENGDKLKRSVAQLDKTTRRELLKMGVIYVQQGQELQGEILRNDRASRSTAFSEFIHALGWTVDMKTHLGYRGGLDHMNLTTGETSPYYANHAVELLFHDITSMPTVQDDDQQILKKRHVGNDIVHIVWSEHCRPYKPSTIVSQFNDAHIVVYPTANGLFRVQIFRKPKVPLFGPLVDGMVIGKQLLGPLVRQTAINANRYVRLNTPGYENPIITRRRYTEEIAKKYTIEKDEELLLSEVVQQTQDKKYLATRDQSV